MKKYVTTLMAVIMMFCVCCFAGCEQSLTDYTDGLTPSSGLEIHHISELEDGVFSLNFKEWVEGDDYYVVTGIGTCEDKVIVVPATYEGKPVKAISDRAFFQVDGIEGFILPNSVESIGQLSFRSGIKVLKGNGVRCYGDGCCGGIVMKNVVLSQKTEYIAQWAFFFAPEAETIWIPKTVTKIGAQPFMDSGFTKVYYEGSEEDWNKIVFETGECDIDISIEYNVAYPGIED